MSKKVSRRAYKQEARDKQSRRKQTASKKAPAPAKEFPVAPPPPPPPATYKELIDRHELVVEHADVQQMRRIVVRKGRTAVAAFVTPGTLSPAGWGSKGRKLHTLIGHHLAIANEAKDWLDDGGIKDKFIAMLGKEGWQHLLDLHKLKALEIAAEAAATSADLASTLDKAVAIVAQVAEPVF